MEIGLISTGNLAGKSGWDYPLIPPYKQHQAASNQLLNKIKVSVNRRFLPFLELPLPLQLCIQNLFLTVKEFLHFLQLRGKLGEEPLLILGGVNNLLEHPVNQSLYVVAEGLEFLVLLVFLYDGNTFHIKAQVQLQSMAGSWTGLLPTW